jgi:hypothetical protein
MVSMSRSSKRLGIPVGQNKSRQISGSNSTGLPRPRSTRSAKRPTRTRKTLPITSERSRKLAICESEWPALRFPPHKRRRRQRPSTCQRSLRGESPSRQKLRAPRHAQPPVHPRLRARSPRSGDEHLLCDCDFRPKRLLFAFASDPPPANIASAESLRPIYAIDGLVRSSLRFCNIAAQCSDC